MAMEFQPILILSSFLAVVQLILTMVPGVWYTRKGLVSKEMRRSISTIAFNLLLPCVVFMNIADNINASTIASYWPFLMHTTISLVVGLFLGWVINEVTGTPSHLRYHVIACAGLANVNSLPLMITTAVCNQDNMPFYQTLGDQCVTVGWTYVAVSSAVVQIFGFPISKWLLVKRPMPPRSFLEVVQKLSGRILRGVSRVSRSSKQLPDTEMAAAASGGLAVVPKPRKAVSAPHSLSLDKQLHTVGDLDAAAAALALPHLKEGEVAQGQAAVKDAEQLDRAESGAISGAGSRRSAVTATKGRVSSRWEDSDEEEEELEETDEKEAAGVIDADPEVPAIMRGRMYRWGRAAWRFTYEYLLMIPTITAVLSLGVGCASPIQKLFFPEQSAPLGFITGAISSLQNSYVFIASFVLGAAMAWGPGRGTKSVGLQPCIAVVAVRFLILPVLGCLLVVGTIKAGWYMPDNPVFPFLLLLQYTVPTSNQVQNMASMYQNHEKEIGAMIFWEYMISMIAIPGWMVFYLWLMGQFDLYTGA